MNNIVVKDLYINITKIRNIFISFNEEYDKIDKILKANAFSIDMINVLSSLKDRYQMDDSVITFIDDICHDIKVIMKKIEEIRIKKSLLKDKVEEFKCNVGFEKFKSYNITIPERNGLKSLFEMNEYLMMLNDIDSKLNETIASYKSQNNIVLDNYINVVALSDENDEINNITSSDEVFSNTFGRVAPNILIMIVAMVVVSISVFIATGIFNLLK